MTTKQAENYRHTVNALTNLGFEHEEIAALFRIERALQRWGEMECGTDHGCIERDDTTGKPHWLNATTMKRTPVADREAGALKRLDAIMAKHPKLLAYHQGDCRGCSLYVLRRRDVVRGEDVGSLYTRGVAVCY